MTAPRSFKYRAFLSYSHLDHEAGERLHKALETFRVPQGIAGKDGDYGKVPGKLRPIFRDRFDLEAGHSLGAQVMSALQESEALIVLCSPASAKSKYVQSEIVTFKRLGRSDRIYPIIIDGEPGHPENDCFPKPLRFKVTADGTITDEPEEPLAADARPHGDGWELARLKLVAGLLGVDLDELRRREAEDERRWRRIWAGVAGCMAILAVASGVLWRSAEYERSEKAKALVQEQKALAERTIALEKTERLSAAILERTTSLVRKSVATTDEFGVPVRVGVGILKEAEGIFGDMDRVGVETQDLSIGRARMLLSFADSLGRLGKVAEQKEKSDAALALSSALLAKAPTHPDILDLRADALQRSGHVWSARYEINQALDAFKSALSLRETSLGGAATDHPEHLNALAILLKDIAVAHNRNGEPRLALDLARRAVTVADRLAGMEGQELAAAESRAACLVVIADMHRQLGNRDDALAAVADGISYVDQTLALTADSVPWLRRKSHFHLIEGDVHKANRDYPKALTEYAAAHRIRQRLHDADTQNATISVETGYARVKLGEVLLAQSERDAAEREFEQALALYDAVIALNPEHRLAARHSLDALDGLGEVFRQKKTPQKMLETAQRKLTIAAHILSADPANRDAQRSVARVRISIGDAYRELKEEDRAIESYGLAGTEMQKLREPSLSDERELATALENLGDTLAAKARGEEAERILQMAIDLRRGHAERAGATVGAKQRHAYAMEKLAEVHLDQGKALKALELVEASIKIREPLIDQETSPETYRQLALAYDYHARAKIALGDPAAALSTIAKALPIRERLLTGKPDEPQRRRNLAFTLKLKGEALLAQGDCTGAEPLTTAKAELATAIGAAGGNERWTLLDAEIAALLARSSACSTASPAAPAAPQPADSDTSATTAH